MNDVEFRNMLTRSQRFNPDLQHKYERGLAQMFTRKLTTLQRVGYGLASLIGLLLGIKTAVGLIFFYPDAASTAFRWMIAAVTCIVLAISVVGAQAAVKGVLKTKTTSKTIGGIAWYGGLSIAGIVFLWLSRGGDPPRDPAYVLLWALVPLIVGGVRYLQEQGRQSELGLRQSLLEMELRLADISERLENQPTSSH